MEATETVYVINYSFESKAHDDRAGMIFYDDYEGTDLKLMLNTRLGQQQNSSYNKNRKILSIRTKSQVVA